MKSFKVISHQKNYSEDSLLIHSKDHPTLNVGDVVEILSPDNEFKFILRVSFLPKDQPYKDNTISIEHSIATIFQIKPYAEVYVSAVNPKDFSLDSLEITFKDQYLARSDMWRFKKCLVNSCMYPNKKLEFCGTRCQVFEMYAQGEKVTCGIVTEDTKIVYRSCSSMVYIFIQMSCEMWHFDINGDLYFEKAINGFLPDLFTKWKKLNCNHDVTIVLFSRIFYDAHSSDEFPLYMRECLQQDYKGRFFEDFYRVAVQNERYDDWSSTIILLKKQFNQYQKAVLEYHQRPDVTIPSAVISTSSQGNFLEVLNMSLNVFEKHYMDRSFDRTGQLSIVISPGLGVFEVDRELTLITKQRIINNGIGSDLVCLGEQPLHAVPLFKFYNKCSSHIPALVDDYNMPHWINLSFYSSMEHICYANFVPRVKIPTPLPDCYKGKIQNSQYSRSRHASQPEASFPDVFDYDEYDSQVFRMPTYSMGTRHTCSLQRPGRKKEGYLGNTTGSTHNKVKEDLASKFISSDPLPISSTMHACSAAIAIPTHGAHKNGLMSSCQHSEEIVQAHFRQSSKDDMELDFTPPIRGVIGSAGSPYEPLFNRQLSHRPKPLVNPFDPSHITIKLTSNRRRWTHVFPLGPTGIFMQQHHYQAIPQISASNLASLDLEGAALNIENLRLSNLDLLHSRNFPTNIDEEYDDSKLGVHKKGIHSSASFASLAGMDVHTPSSGARIPSSSHSNMPHGNPSFTWLWGATGEQEWTPALTTGVDWKSLVIPACLPITTDYFPDERSLENYYVLSDYILCPQDIIAENAPSKYYRKDEDPRSQPMTTVEVYNELICQRLQQGFQIILLIKQSQSYPLTQVSSSPQFAPPPILRGRQSVEHMEECLMSIGKIFHQLTMNGSEIKVTQYRPRFPYREIKIHYCYRFHAPDSDTYGVSWVDFTSEKLENYSWNYLDHSICMKGDGEFKLKDSLKFWRLRLLILPGAHIATRQILEGSEHCDLYSKFSPEDKMQQKEGFLKFLEVLNKIRHTGAKKPRLQPQSSLPPRRSSLGQSVLLQSSSLLASSFRDRVSSNRIHDRPRLRSHSAKMGARADPPPAVGRISPATEADGRLTGSNHSLQSQIEGDVADESICSEMKLLSENSSDAEIIEAMKNPQDGLNFVLRTGLPNYSFISGEAVSWIIEHVEGVSSEHQSISLLQNMIVKGLICHASGVKKHPFIHGFYLFYIVPDEDRTIDRVYDKEEECSSLFQREYLEVELNPSLPMSPLSLSYVFSNEDFWDAIPEKEPSLKFRCTDLEIDQGTKSGRQEWGQARYQSVFEPCEAFEIVIEWMVATGNIAADLVQGWARKSTSYNLQLVPIPSDPFALPFTDDSDPLRGPIFIALDLSCLMDTVVQSIDEIGLLMLQEKILCKFGFIPYQNSSLSNPPQYVHISGSMFVMIPTRQKESKEIFSRSSSAMDLQQISSPHDEYITRHFSGIRKEDLCAMKVESDTKIGFLWSWNYMITKRWKNAGTVDENFMRKVMRDFRAFCANQDGRLEEFYKCTLLSHFHNDSSLLMPLEI